MFVFGTETRDAIRIAVCQFAVTDCNPALNMAKIEQMLRDVSRAPGGKPDAAILPELAVEGYAFTAPYWNARPPEETVRAFYSRIAANSGINIIAGFAEEDAGRWYDSAACFSTDGGAAVYRKIHLWRDEASFFSPGDGVSYFEIAGWKIAPIICADIGFPELARRVANEGAELIAVVGAWSNPFGYMWRSCNVARATENQLGLVASNRLGDDIAGGSFCGASLAVNERGEILGCLGNEPGFFISEFSKSAMEQWRENVPWRKMRRPDVYCL